MSSTMSVLAYLGLPLFTWGIIDKKRQAVLFFTGGAMLCTFAFYGGNPVFIGAQSIMLVASFMRLRKTERSSEVTIFLACLVLIGMFVRTEIETALDWIGASATLGLVFGVAYAATITGNIFFAIGGALMTVFAYLVGSLPFFFLNVIFMLAVLWEIFSALLQKSKKPA